MFLLLPSWRVKPDDDDRIQGDRKCHHYDDLLSICDCSIAVSCTVFEIYDVEEFRGHEILN